MDGELRGRRVVVQSLPRQVQVLRADTWVTFIRIPENAFLYLAGKPFSYSRTTPRTSISVLPRFTSAGFGFNRELHLGAFVSQGNGSGYRAGLICLIVRRIHFGGQSPHVSHIVQLLILSTFHSSLNHPAFLTLHISAKISTPLLFSSSK